MIKKVKSIVKRFLKEKYDREYERELLSHTLDYHDWVTLKEAERKKKDNSKGQSGVVSISRSFFDLQNPGNYREILEKEEIEVIFLASSVHDIRPGAREKIEKIFADNESIQLLYTDEDEIEAGRRRNPWFKPDFSPETLLSYFYFGNFIALRKSFLLSCNIKNDIVSHQQKNKGGHEIVYRIILDNIYRLTDRNVFHLKEVCYSSQSRLDSWERKDFLKKELEEKSKAGWENKVSIIIPSKDHPDLIEQCFKALKNTIKEIKYEIILIDNGSSPDNKLKLEEITSAYGAAYYYEPMDFNFSTMCNLGARKALHDLLLFLNDDCEAVKEGWLEAMAALAIKRKTGAVGTKLYYPDSIMIQHCGIYNIHVGPVHKLQFKEDNQLYYDGRNRGIRNVLAVTAACLMIRKDVFRQVCGYDEKLAVAFNDVDLCYRVYKAGYRNVVNNDIYLYHHESLSRGSDEGEEKMKRLMLEKQKLYKRHADIWNKDPYYHPDFTDDILDTGFSFGFEVFPVKEPDILSPDEGRYNYEIIREDACIVTMVEYAGEPEGWFLNKTLNYFENPKDAKKFFYLQGNVVVLGSDNACFNKKLLLHHMESDKIYEVSPGLRYRPDMVHNLPDQENVGLGGFSCFIDKRRLPKGKYRVEFLVSDKISGTCLLRRTENYLNNTG